ncbi:MAG: aconitate hydratase AcnA [Anaerolineae bacterium]|nr:aconitate hydratase AcnA [Anaerolineae bacterium]
MAKNTFNARAALATSGAEVTYYRLSKLQEDGIAAIDRLPFSIKILLESLLRNEDGHVIRREDIEALARWDGATENPHELPFSPTRVVLQDFTGVPALVDLAALRSAVARMGGDPSRINPLVPVDLVVDHSVQVDSFGSFDALRINAEMEFERNRERYEFLHWGQKAFDNFRVVPPATGIVHQVNLEYLASVVRLEDGVAMPDTLVGTDSHTTMINGLGVLGWGVGGIEAEAAMLGQPIYMLTPQVVGFKLYGKLREGVTATDLTLTVVQMLRKKGVVGKFVEFYGEGLSSMSLPDRATIANMAPEYGATMGFFPVDAETLRFLERTARPAALIDLVERYAKAQGLFRTDSTPDPVFTDTLELDLGTVVPSMAGPKRPQDRIPLDEMKAAFETALSAPVGASGFGLDEAALAKKARVSDNGASYELTHGSVVIAAITSCTNTSNPSVMLGAGLVAKNAVEKGLKVAPYVKTSLAPGSRVVTEYLKAAGLLPYLEQLGYHVVGYGCTTCIGNSGPLAAEIASAIQANDLVAASVSSGNRNFEGRINPFAKANYLASPPLVVAYALAGTVDIDLYNDPIGHNDAGEPVYLKDIWPTQQQVLDTMAASIRPEMFAEQYANVFDGNETWNAIDSGDSEVYGWNPDSTYIQEPPFFVDMTPEPAPIAPIRAARALAVLGDSVTTDHISPAGNIPKDGPAGQYLIDQDVSPQWFNSFGSRRGNDRVMTRGTFANIRLRNQLAPGTEGGYTTYLPTGEVTTIYDAAMRYRDSGTPLVVLAGKEYGTGSSRDWAAKGALLLGVRAVIAESFERIHRSNLVGMGVLPLQFEEGQSAETLSLSGKETFAIDVDDSLQPGEKVTVTVTRADGSTATFNAIARIDTPVEITYYRNGGILHTVLRSMISGA